MRYAVTSAALFFISTLAHAATIHVPSDFTEIQKAIQAAKHGDTVLVASGTYVENIDFLGKAIRVMSSSGPDVTAIDGSGGNSVVTFQSGETPDSLLDGFTIRCGKNSFSYGGGISCWKFSSPTIRGNIIQGNTASFGGGIGCLDHACPIVSKNLIVGNLATGDGGGIHCGPDCALLIMDNRIGSNKAGDEGGGIFCEHVNAQISNNFIFDNSASYSGGGISLIASSESVIANNTLYGNSAFLGGGVFCSSGSKPVVFNAILWNNSAGNGKEIYVNGSGSPCELAILFSDVQGGKNDVHVDPPSKLIWGPGMVEAEPIFTDPLNQDFHLSWRSPCINRGTNKDAPPHDIDGEPRPFMGTVDMGADEHSGPHSLGADAFKIPPSTGGKILFSLDAGPGCGGRGYMLFASLSGTAPGTLLPGGGAVMPLNWDAFTYMVLGLVNKAPFQNFSGNLDSMGMASAVLDTLGPVQGSSGYFLFFAFAVTKPWDFASNPIMVAVQE